MPTSGLPKMLKAAVIAGLIAGLVMGLFHFLVTERVIDQAIALEAQAHAGSGVTETFVVSREAQKAMLVVGSGLYGIVVGSIFAFVFALLERRLPGKRPGVKALLLAGTAWWFFGFLLQAKYSAALPGVGDPETVFRRQWLQIGFPALLILVMVFSLITYRLCRMAGAGRAAQLGAASLVYIAATGLAFVLMPNNPPVPAELARMSAVFGLLSISGHAVFWAVLGGVFALELKRNPDERGILLAVAPLAESLSRQTSPSTKRSL